MKVIQPKEFNNKEIESNLNLINIFMGGGMGNTEWHSKFLDYFAETGSYLTIFNPYNPNIDDLFRQVMWEYKVLEAYKKSRVFIYSFYFDKYTNQPMSCFELGKMITLKTNKQVYTILDKDGNVIEAIGDNNDFDLVITVHPESPIKNEIITQCQCANVACIIGDIDMHIKCVWDMYRCNKKHFC